jgi:hypothetical protein
MNTTTGLTQTWVSVVDADGRERLEVVWTTPGAATHAAHAA